MAAPPQDRTGIIGASGYTGAELLRLAAGHPSLDVGAGHRRHPGRHPGGRPVPEPGRRLPRPGLRAVRPGRGRRPRPRLPGPAPRRVAAGRARVCASGSALIVDLAADFRLTDAALYPQWYGEAHTAPELLAEFVYGLPELFRDELAGADLVAAPGCYSTAAALALAPLVRAGAGRADRHHRRRRQRRVRAPAGRRSRHTHFCTVDEDFTAYGLLDHRHTPEIEQAIGAQVLFTPHLAPDEPGHPRHLLRPARPARRPTDRRCSACSRDAYADEPFVVVTRALAVDQGHARAPTPPTSPPASTRAPAGSSRSCALDNLVKGASGQAIQCANLALGLPRRPACPLVGVYP